MVPTSDGTFKIDSSVTAHDVIGTAIIVESPTIVIGGNITALKWASVDAVTPGNAQIRAAYHWLKDTIRELEIDLRDIPSALNLADFLTKVVMGLAMRSSSYAASGYTKPPPIALPAPVATRAFTTAIIFQTMSVGGYVAKTKPDQG